MMQYRARRCPASGSWLLLALAALPPAGASCAPVQADPETPAVLASYRPDAGHARLEIAYPFDGALFPPEIAPPTFRWTDPDASCDAWLVALEFADGNPPVLGRTEEKRWTPDAATWADIKRRSTAAPARVLVLGYRAAAPGQAVSAGEIRIGTSTDPVGAAIFYRDVPLPFIDAVKDPSRIAWRMGTVDSVAQPPVVLAHLPVCGNCHSFSADGGVLGMDIDYANDKGSYALTTVSPEITLDEGKIITWSDYRREDRQPTFGLLSQVSPDGRYAVSTVKDRSVFIAMPDLAFSQLFFPIRGVLAIYDRQAKTFASLPGADDPAFCQSNASWTPDGKAVVFARAPAYQLKHATDPDKILLTAEECSEFVTGGEKLRYDLYRVPFNQGRGGRAEPLPGASEDGVSEYFPKVSPDGRWIVFCRAPSFMLLQEGSALYIMPAEGGEPQRMRCNCSRMNSWHSWSPNGRWLVFSSKHFSAYTQLMLAHVDAEGRSSAPVLLEHFTTEDRAANIPEFVAPAAGRITAIREAFVNAVSFVRAAQELIQAKDLDRAAQACEKALAIDPQCVEAHNLLGFICQTHGQLEGAAAHFRRAIEADPDHATARANLAGLLVRGGRTAEALEHYRRILRTDPDNGRAHGGIGALLLAAGRMEEATAHLKEAVRLDPDPADSQYNLAQALARLGKLDDAIGHYREAVRLRPEDAYALRGLGLTLFETGQRQEGLALLAEAVRRAPDVSIHMAYGDTLLAAGQYGPAAEQYARARACAPDEPQAAAALAWVRATAPDAALRNGAEAVRLAEAAVATSPSPSAYALDALAAAYAESGRFEEAARYAARAFVLARDQKHEALARQIAARHQMYREGKPFRMTAPPSGAPDGPTATPPAPLQAAP